MSAFRSGRSGVGVPFRSVPFVPFYCDAIAREWANEFLDSLHKSFAQPEAPSTTRLSPVKLGELYRERNAGSPLDLVNHQGISKRSIRPVLNDSCDPGKIILVVLSSFVHPKLSGQPE